MKLLFVKEKLAWPRSSGHDVHCFYMMRELARQGHAVALATVIEPVAEAIAGLELAGLVSLKSSPRGTNHLPLRLSALQERFRSFWGIDPEMIAAVGQAARDFQADAVVVVGLNVLPYLGAVKNSLRVWYAADEWVWHHLTQLRPWKRSTWANLPLAAVKGAYERVYGPLLDQIWVVTEEDRRAMHCVSGVSDLQVLPNGVDSDYYSPSAGAANPDSCTFWGRLDFGPNVQALEWFCERIWPELRRQRPALRFTIYGFQPTPPVWRLAEKEGVTVIPDLPDLRPEVGRQALAVFPFVSGGGVKNKLLEAAAMGKAIVCTSLALQGLRGKPIPVRRAERPKEWVRQILDLLDDADSRHQLGLQARRWVVAHHSWQATAKEATRALETALERN